MDRSYSKMLLRETFTDRFNYLALGGGVGEETFGWKRDLNQEFYRSKEWRRIRDEVILRDEGMDLAVFGRPIFGKVLVHHINPITATDIIHGSDLLLDPDNLVCVSINTHNAIHYGSADILQTPFVERQPGDTLLW